MKHIPSMEHLWHDLYSLIHHHNLAQVSHFMWFIAKDASYQVLACYRQPAIGFFWVVSLNIVLFDLGWFGHLYNLPPSMELQGIWRLNSSLKGLVIRFHDGLVQIVVWCLLMSPPKLSLEERMVLSNMPFFLIPLSTFWNRFLYPPTIFFGGKEKHFL